ncbi:hypothetical protein [Tabrizicola sp.]|uniref:hypothetical protein n=1 Tax=Tabrizicola sp. TaxID=2005166 RepID=UPI003F2CB5FA
MPRLRALLAVAVAVGAVMVSVPAEAKPKHCPPGLAKKAVPCVPPGQVGKSWKQGDRVEGGYVLIPREDWERWNLRDYDDGSTYLRVDDEILRVVRDTLTVIEAVGIVSELLN